MEFWEKTAFLPLFCVFSQIFDAIPSDSDIMFKMGGVQFCWNKEVGLMLNIRQLPLEERDLASTAGGYREFHINPSIFLFPSLSDSHLCLMPSVLRFSSSHYKKDFAQDRTVFDQLLNFSMLKKNSGADRLGEPKNQISELYTHKRYSALHFCVWVNHNGKRAPGGAKIFNFRKLS